MKFSLRVLFAAIALIAIVFAGVGILLRSCNVPRSYAVKVSFTSLPADDVQLRSWLTSQHGVSDVHIVRDDEGIRIYWTMIQDFTNSPPPPDLHGEFDRLGYKGEYDFHDDWLD